MAHQVTFKYYMGVTSFLEEDYARVSHIRFKVDQQLIRNLQAEEYLQSAWQRCYPSSHKNKSYVICLLLQQLAQEILTDKTG